MIQCHPECKLCIARNSIIMEDSEYLKLDRLQRKLLIFSDDTLIISYDYNTNRTSYYFDTPISADISHLNRRMRNSYEKLFNYTDKELDYHGVAIA